MHVFIDNQRFYLLKGIEPYHILKVLYPNQEVYCQIHDVKLSKEEWMINFLQSCFLENSYWKVKYEVIVILLNLYDNDASKVSDMTGVKKAEIDKYILDPSIPDQYKGLAIQEGCQPLLNQIAREVNLVIELKEHLYKWVFRQHRPLTAQNMADLKNYFKDFRLGNDINTAKIQLQDIFNRKKALFENWKRCHLYAEEEVKTVNYSHETFQNESGPFIN